jgi:hypothetical protein
MSDVSNSIDPGMHVRRDPHGVMKICTRCFRGSSSFTREADDDELFELLLVEIMQQPALIREAGRRAFDDEINAPGRAAWTTDFALLGD